MMEPGELIERLRISARQASEISRHMAEAKSLRQESNTERRTDLYMWSKPEQTAEWQAADALEAALLRISELEGHIGEQITHVETRIQDGIELGATVWRIALEDVARENRVVLSPLGG
jgi:hypothetical protein